MKNTEKILFITLVTIVVVGVGILVTRAYQGDKHFAYQNSLTSDQ